MAPWIEFEGHIEVDAQFGSILVMDKTNSIGRGDIVTIGRQTTGFLGRTIISETEVKIIDNDSAQVIRKRPLERRVTAAGFVGAMAVRLQHTDITPDSGKVLPIEISEFTHGEIWESSKGKIHGVSWLNSEGERQKPVVVTSKRAYYEGDKDPEAQEVLKSCTKQFAHVKQT